MKAEELMIGDWVYQALYQDTEIPNKGHGWKVVRVTKCPFDEDWAIAPIPLTDKMLVKNGFNFDRDNGWEYCGKNYEPLICYSVEDKYLCIDYDSLNSEFRVGFVHELQQALRSRGLRDMANNFNVE